MVNNAHLITKRGDVPTLIVRDDRGLPVSELELPRSVTQPHQADDELRYAGWTRSAEWTAADDGWVVPVVRVEDAKPAT